MTVSNSPGCTWVACMKNLNALSKFFSFSKAWPTLFQSLALFLFTWSYTKHKMDKRIQHRLHHSNSSDAPTMKVSSQPLIHWIWETQNAHRASVHERTSCIHGSFTAALKWTSELLLLTCGICYKIEEEMFLEDYSTLPAYHLGPCTEKAWSLHVISYQFAKHKKDEVFQGESMHIQRWIHPQQWKGVCVKVMYQCHPHRCLEIRGLLSF